MLGRLIILLFLSIPAHADWVLLDEMYVDYQNHALINKNNRNSLLYPEATKETLDLTIKTSVLVFGYWNSKVKSWTTDAQYRAIGLELEFGVHLSDSLDIYYRHESDHLLDRHHSYMTKYPVADAIGIRLFLFKRKD